MLTPPVFLWQKLQLSLIKTFEAGSKTLCAVSLGKRALRQPPGSQRRGHGVLRRCEQVLQARRRLLLRGREATALGLPGALRGAGAAARMPSLVSYYDRAQHCFYIYVNVNKILKKVFSF